MLIACLPTVHASVCHQMSVLVMEMCSLKWTSLNRFPVMATKVSLVGEEGRAEESHVWCLRVGTGEGLMSYVQGGQGWGGILYSEVQCIMGNGHKGSPHGQNDGQTGLKTLLPTTLLVGSNNKWSLSR